MTKLTSAALWFAAAATSAMACVCPATTTCRLLGQQVLFAGEVTAVDGKTVQIRVKERFYGLPESPANVQLLVLDPCNGVRYSPGQLWVFGAGYWNGRLVQGPCGAIAMAVSGNSAALETIRLVTASRSKRRIFGLVGLSNHPRFFSVRMNAGIDRLASGVRSTGHK